MRANPYDKYLTKEDHLHIAVVNYLRLKYPDVFVMHCPNEGRRTKFERYKAKLLGMTAGIPDLLIFYGLGLALELKIKPNKPTKNQLDCMDKLTNAGWECHVCYTFEEAKDWIDEYLSE